MALTFDATLEGAAANSYITEAEAAAYFDGRLNADPWTNAAQGTRQRALVMATTRLERVTWLGSPTTTTQRLKWPRSGVRDELGTLFTGDTIPRPLQEATCELALHLLRLGSTDPAAADDLAGIESITIGPLSLTRAAAPPGDSDLPAEVRRCLARLAAAGSGTFRIVRA